MTAQIRKYETIIVSRPGLELEEREALHKKITDMIQAHAGDLIVFEVWGKRRLAYTIKKNQKGFYTYYMYVGDSGTINELNAMLRLREDVLKYLTVKLADSVDTAGLEEERNLEEFTKDDEHGDSHNSGYANAAKPVAAEADKTPEAPVSAPGKKTEETPEDSGRKDA